MCVRFLIFVVFVEKLSQNRLNIWRPSSEVLTTLLPTVKYIFV